MSSENINKRQQQLPNSSSMPQTTSTPRYNSGLKATTITINTSSESDSRRVPLISSSTPPPWNRLSNEIRPPTPELSFLNEQDYIDYYERQQQQYQQKYYQRDQLLRLSEEVLQKFDHQNDDVNCNNENDRSNKPERPLQPDQISSSSSGYPSYRSPTVERSFSGGEVSEVVRPVKEKSDAVADVHLPSLPHIDIGPGKIEPPNITTMTQKSLSETKTTKLKAGKQAATIPKLMIPLSNDLTCTSTQEVEWTPVDSAYGAACPVFGCMPKPIRRAIETTLISFLFLSLILFFVVISVQLTNQHKGYEPNSNIVTNDDYYVSNSGNDVHDDGYYRYYEEDDDLMENATSAVDDDFSAYEDNNDNDNY